MTISNSPVDKQDQVSNDFAVNALKKRERRAYYIHILFLVVILANFLLSLKFGIEDESWQFLVRGVILFVFGILTIISIRWLKQGRAEASIWLVLVGFFISIITTGALIANAGSFLVAIVILITLAIAVQALPPEKTGKAILASTGAAAATYMFEFVAPSFRVPSPPLFITSLTVLGTITIIILSWFMIRDFINYPLRGKLIIALVGVVALTLLPVAGIFLYQINSNLHTQAVKTQIEDVQNKESDITIFLSNIQSDALFLSHSAVFESYLTLFPSGENTAESRQLVETEFLAFIQAHQNYTQVRFLDAKGEEIVRVDRSAVGLVTLTPENDLQNKADRYYFQHSIELPAGNVYISPLDLNVEHGQIEEPHKPVIRYATPVYFENEIQGIIIINVLAEEFLAPLGAGESEAFLVDGEGYYLYHPEQAKRWGRDLETGVNLFDDLPELGSSLTAGTSTSFQSDEYLYAWTPVTLPGEDTPRWRLINYSPVETSFAPVNSALRTGMITFTIALAFAVIFTYFLSNIISKPVVKLTKVVEELSTGNLKARASVGSSDEIGTLANAFNNMSSQLDDLISTLEERVMERTQALEASTEVSRRLSTILDEKQLTHEVVEQIHHALHYYHVHIYTLDEQSGDLLLASGTGKVGQTMMRNNHKVTKGKGLVGRAAIENKPIFVPNVANDSAWMSNPLLPETQSEIASPISIGERVLGVLDVQHNLPYGLDEEDVKLLQSIANQAAVAMQNARSFEKAQQEAEQKTLINTISEKIQRATTVEDVLQIAARELSLMRDVKRANVQLDPYGKNTQEKVA